MATNVVARRLLACFVATVIASMVGGCAPKVEMKPIDQFRGIEDSDREKIKGYLEAAGVKGPLISVQETSPDEWTAQIGQVPEPGKRALPVPPERYSINKADGKVTKMSMGP